MRYKQRNKEKCEQWATKSRARYEAKNPERVRASKARYRQENRQKILAVKAARYEREKPSIAKKRRAYREAKPWLHAAGQREREVRKRHAMPPWVDRSAIQRIYKKAHDETIRTGVKYSVDHIYALRGKTFCGLHVPWNLQVIPLIENCRKGAKPPSVPGG